MAYITEDKLGLQRFPLTGNPFDSVAVYAHPDGVANLVASCDGQWLFSSGGANSNVFVWRVGVASLEAQVKARRYSKRISSVVLLFYCLLEQFCEV